MVTRVLDLAILLLLAAAILMPRPDVKIKPALPPDTATRQRVAELQTQLLATPGNVAATLELADVFMDLRHPDWALASLAGALDAHPDDHRLHHLASLALADHFEPGYAYAEAQKALTLCESGSCVACGEAERGRLDLLKSTLERIKNMDMRRDPNSAKAALIQGLRMTFIPKKAAQKPEKKDTSAPRAGSKPSTHP
ncbi:MAG TPA: hypothetical protein VJ860_20375 [Polyangia bacterium]|nr:hypothetical protein [Polyangia bacterium]